LPPGWRAPGRSAGASIARGTGLAAGADRLRSSCAAGGEQSLCDVDTTRLADGTGVRAVDVAGRRGR
jgi:hypothetical protein